MNRSRSVSFAVLLVSSAAVFIIIWGIRSLASILNPILLATIITIVVMPVPQKLSERGLPDWLSFSACYPATDLEQCKTSSSPER